MENAIEIFYGDLNKFLLTKDLCDNLSINNRLFFQSILFLFFQQFHNCFVFLQCMVTSSCFPKEQYPFAKYRNLYLVFIVVKKALLAVNVVLKSDQACNSVFIQTVIVLPVKTSICSNLTKHFFVAFYCDTREYNLHLREC